MFVSVRGRSLARFTRNSKDRRNKWNNDEIIMSVCTSVFGVLLLALVHLLTVLTCMHVSIPSHTLPVDMTSLFSECIKQHIAPINTLEKETTTTNIPNILPLLLSNRSQCLNSCDVFLVVALKCYPHRIPFRILCTASNPNILVSWLSHFALTTTLANKP